MSNTDLSLEVTGNDTSHITITGNATIETYTSLLSTNILYGLTPFAEPPCPLNRRIRITVNNGRLVDHMTVTWSSHD